MTETLLILSGGAEAAHVARRAKDLGLYVVVADGDPEAPGFAQSDSRLIANACSGDEIGAASERFSRKVRRIDGLVSAASASTAALAAACARLRLPGLSRRSAQLLTNRLAMNERLQEAGVSVPWFAEIATPQELARVAVERGEELLLMPAEGTTGAAQRLSAGKNLNEAFARVQSASGEGRIMVQQHLPGRRLWSASIVVEDRCYTPALGDRASDDDAPFPFVAGVDLPGSVTSDERAQITDVIARSASAMGITEGPVECVIVIDQGKPHVVEIACRLPGTAMAMRGIERSTGVDYAAAVIRLALGERVAASALEPVRNEPVVQRCLFVPAGRVSSVTGDEDARSVPGVVEVDIDVKPGAVLQEPGAQTPVATILATGETRETALAAAHRGLASVRIETEGPQAAA